MGTWKRGKDGKPISYVELSDKNLPLLERKYQDGKLTETLVYGENGLLKARTRYDAREIATEISKWSPSGRLIETTQYLNNYKHGLQQLYSPSTGALLERSEYQNDRLHGLSEQYFDQPGHETIRERRGYSNGQADGEYRVYYSDGSLEECGTVENGQYQGIRRRFYRGGHPKSVYRYLDGKLEGAAEEFHENGVCSRRMSFKNDGRHGIEESFNARGELQHRSAWLEGKSTKDFAPFVKDPDACETIELFFASGELSTRYSYKGGILHGPFETFRPSGQKLETGRYENGKLDGPVTRYGSDGARVETTTYRAGLKQDVRTLYFPTGEMSAVEQYESDRLFSRHEFYMNGEIRRSFEVGPDGIGSEAEYFDDGQIKVDAQFISNLASMYRVWHGTVRIYSSDGILRSVSDYQLGQLHGRRREFDAIGYLEKELEYLDGSVRRALHFIDGSRVGREITYYEDGSVKTDESFPDTGAAQVEEAPTGEIRAGTLVGPFKIVRAIGHGGMGDVFLAQEAELDRKVAVKLIRGAAKDATGEEALKRFMAEGRSLARIQHKNVVTVYSMGTYDGGPYMAMEFVDGWPLSALLGQGLLGFNEQVSLFRQMLEGMQAAHAATVLHRDLKPANLIVGKDMALKIIDFGISKILLEDHTQITAPNVVVGTIKYMAPEILLGLPACVQTDIYSLGVVFFEMLTGTAPFRAVTQLELIEKIKSQPVVFPEGISEILPDALKDLILAMTAKAVEARPATMLEVRTRLDGISFAHLPEEFKMPMHPGIEIANVSEIRKQLQERGRNPSELSLIINLASRIQQRMLFDPDKTEALTVTVDELVISPEALAKATERYDLAKKGLADSRRRT